MAEYSGVSHSSSSRPPVIEPPDLTVVARYLTGESDAVERRHVDAWAGASVENAQWLRDLRQMWSAEPGVRGGWDLESLWGRVIRSRRETEGGAFVPSGASQSAASAAFLDAGFRREQPTAPAGLRTRAQTPRGRWQIVGTCAATIALVLSVGVFRLGGTRAVGTTRTYTTPVGRQATVTLGDGTRITLAPQTRLRLVNFGAQSRTVLLDGEAYFEVTRSSGAPFAVRSGSVTTRVLGTAFLVRHYATDAHLLVAVSEGKVSLSSESPAIAGLTLTAGRIGEVTDSTVKVSRVDDLVVETGWVDGKLVFNDASVSEVLATLRRWYGYEFRVSDESVARQHVTVALSTQSSAAALANLEQILGVRLTIRGDTVTLTPAHSRKMKGQSPARGYDVWTPTREVGR